MPLNSAWTQSCRSAVLKRLYLRGFRLGGGTYISNERSAEWYIRVSGIVNHLQWIFPFVRSTFWSTQCAGSFWKGLWLTHKRITDTCTHTLSKASATHQGPGLNLSSRSRPDIFCCDTPDLPVPSSSLGGHACMYVWDWGLELQIKFQTEWEWTPLYTAQWLFRSNL